LILISEFSGKIRGLKDKEWEASGVSRIAGTFAYTIDPPAAILYAVDPVGVDIINPSPTHVVK